MSDENTFQYLDDFLIRTFWGTYSTKVGVGLGDEQLTLDPHKYYGNLLGQYGPKINIPFLNSPFKYAAITKQSFDSSAEAQEHLEDLLINRDMIEVFRKARHSTNIFLYHKTFDVDFIVI